MMRSVVFGLLLAAVLSSVHFAESQVRQEWAVVYNTQTPDYVRDMIIDSYGNIFVAGGGLSSAGSVVKYNPRGQQQWIINYQNAAFHDMALDNRGNIYITGDYYADWPNDTLDYLTLKYDPNGILLWEARFNGTADGPDIAQKLAVDSQGNVFVTGKGMFLPDSDYFACTIKYDSSGNRQWVAVYTGVENYESYAVDIALCSNGDVVVIGDEVMMTTVPPWAAWHWFTIRYSADGVQEWVVNHIGPATWDDYTSALVVDSVDNIYVSGSQTGLQSLDDITTVKYDRDGVQQWVNSFDGSWFNDIPHAIAMGPSGCLYVTGYTKTSEFYNTNYLTLKISPDGQTVWNATYDGAVNDNDYSWSLALDSSENVYVTGNSTYTQNPGFYELVTIKYNTSGQEIWQMHYSYPPLNQIAEGNPAFVALDADNHVYVSGSVLISGIDNFAFATVKYHQSPIRDSHIDLTPLNPPILIHANGGSFQFNAAVVDSGQIQKPFTVWTKIIHSNGNITEPVIGPLRINPPLNVIITRLRTQFIPSSFPSGLAYYIGFAAISYQGIIMDSSWFTYIKSTTSDGGPWITEAACTGELFPGETANDSQPIHYKLCRVSPNPFNPSTTISFELQTTSYVKLKISDTNGRLVTTLIDGQQEAGIHQITFNGSYLTSGIYLYRLTAGQFTASGKMFLLK